MPPRLWTLRSPLPPSLALAPVRSSFLGAYAESFPPLQWSHAGAPQPLLVLEEAAGAKRVQGVNYAYFGIRHQYLS
jgi:hypothetical protein